MIPANHQPIFKKINLLWFKQQQQKLYRQHAYVYKLNNSKIKNRSRIYAFGGLQCYRDLIFNSTSLSYNQAHLTVLAESQDICS